MPLPIAANYSRTHRFGDDSLDELARASCSSFLLLRASHPEAPEALEAMLQSSRSISSEDFTLVLADMGPDPFKTETAGASCKYDVSRLG